MKKLILHSILGLMVLFCLQACTTSKDSTQIAKTIQITSRTKSVVISSKKLKIDWIKPLSSNEIKIEAGKLDIALEASSSLRLKQDDFIVFINDQKVGSKADEVGLFGNDHRFTFRTKIHLVAGENKIEVQIKNNGRKAISKPLLVKYNNGLASLDRGAIARTKEPFVRISWVNPDPVLLEGAMKNHRELELAIDLKINSNRLIRKEQVTIYHNNIPLKPSSKSTFPGENGSYRFRDVIKLNDEESVNKIYVLIENEAGKSQSETLNINFSPFRPNLYLLAIGPKTNLQFTEKDAQDFSNLYKSQGGKTGNEIFNTVETETLVGAKANAGEIKKAIERLSAKYKNGVIGEDDVVMMFISSHGFVLNGELRIQGNDYSHTTPLTTSVSYQSEIIKIINGMPCKKIIFIDACHGAAAGSKGISAKELNSHIKKLNKSRGILTIASSQENEYSYEDAAWQNGAFTKSILYGLGKGKADLDNNLIITANELFNYLKQMVPKLVKSQKGKNQNPAMVKNDLGDVAIFVKNK